MKTATSARVTKIFPLSKQRLFMVHVDSRELNRDWLGLVDLQIGDTTIRMRCEGVGETGDEPAVMLRPVDEAFQAVQDTLAAKSQSAPCPIYVERVMDP
jgi:hypothetical protein